MKRSGALLILAAAVGVLSACSSGASVEPTGHTISVTVSVEDMHFSPDVIEVAAGDELIVEFENTGREIHDITFDSGAASDRLGTGESETVDVGVIGEDQPFWCSVSGHRAQGMEGRIVVTGG